MVLVAFVRIYVSWLVFTFYKLFFLILDFFKRLPGYGTIAWPRVAQRGTRVSPDWNQRGLEYTNDVLNSTKVVQRGPEMARGARLANHGPKCSRIAQKGPEGLRVAPE